jgi:hypothetical protein
MKQELHVNMPYIQTTVELVITEQMKRGMRSDEIIPCYEAFYLYNCFLYFVHFRRHFLYFSSFSFVNIKAMFKTASKKHRYKTGCVFGEEGQGMTCKFSSL